jgi:hypothetical protein
MEKTPNCCICGEKVEEKVNPADGKVYWNQGEDALPVKDGRCCMTCNSNIVLPYRLRAHYQKQEHHS